MILTGGMQASGGMVMRPPVTVAAAAPSIITTGLVLHLDAGNASSYPGSGNTWTDLIGSKVFTLYNNGTGAWTDDPPTYNSANGGHLQFDNSKLQWARCTTSLSSINNYTVESWWYPNSTNITTSNFCVISELEGSRTNYSLGMGQIASNKFFNSYFRTDFQKVLSTNNASTYFNTGWLYMSGTYNNTTGKLNLYINGALAATEATSDEFYRSPTSSFQGMVVGAPSSFGLAQEYQNYLGGSVAIVRIYNAALTSTQITQNYNAQRARFGL